MINSGLKTQKVGLHEFTERKAEAQGNVEKLVRAMINAQLTKDPAIDILDEWTIFHVLNDEKHVSGTVADLLENSAAPARLLDHAALRRFDKSYQHVYVFSPIRFRLHSFQRLRSIEFGGQQQLVGMVNLADAFLAEAAPLQSHGIEP